MLRKYQGWIWVISILMFVAGAYAIDPGSIDEEVALTYGKPEARKALEMRCVRSLKGDAGQTEKERACRILKAIGTDASIGALAALLPDSRLSHFARIALEGASRCDWQGEREDEGGDHTFGWCSPGR